MFGHRVTVLEGHGRPGGRVYTRRLEVSMPARYKSAAHCACSISSNYYGRETVFLQLYNPTFLLPFFGQLWQSSVHLMCLDSSMRPHHLRCRNVFAT